MRDSPFRLQDKTILLTGPFSYVTQVLLRTMTELGSDIAFVNEKATAAGRYAEGVNEAREAHPDYGRAVHLALPLQTEAQVHEALGRVTERVGRIDVWIDATPLEWSAATDIGAAVKLSRVIGEKLLPFFKARGRGRVIYIFEDKCLSTLSVESFADGYQEPLIDHVRELAQNVKDQSVTVNAIGLGVTEDFVLRNFPKSGSIKKSLVELQGRSPGVRLVEALDVTLAAGYLAAPSSASVTGQVIRLTHGL